MSKSEKHIEEGIRSRFLEAIDEMLNGVGNMTVTAIMESVGDYQQSLSLYRSGRRFPTLKNIVLMHQVNGYSLEWLLLGNGKKKNTKSKDPMQRLDEMEKELMLLKKQLKGKKV